jgi:hypothetical protein
LTEEAVLLMYRYRSLLFSLGYFLDLEYHERTHPDADAFAEALLRVYCNSLRCHLAPSVRRTHHAHHLQILM